MDDTDWILMDFTAPKLPQNTDKKPFDNKPLERWKKTGSDNKRGLGATKNRKKTSAKLKCKKV